MPADPLSVVQRLRRWGLLKLAGWARVFGASGTAQRMIEALVAEQPDDAAALAALGFVYMQADRRREALALFERANAARPGNAEMQFASAYLLQGLNNHEAAVEGFRRVLADHPDHDRAWYGLGLSLIALHRLDEAVPPLEKNTKLQPMSPYGWYQLGRVQFERGKIDKTEAIVKHLATFEPKVAAQLARETGVAPPPRP